MLFGRKKNAVPAPKPEPKNDKYSANAITNRTKALRQRAAEFAGSQKTVSEETAKVQLIFPFFKELGWDVSDPKTGALEVIAGEKNKADLMLKKDGVVKVVVEAKAVGINLTDGKYISQLAGYFENCFASIGILTDGIMYYFFSYSKDSEEHMCGVPFAVVDVRDLRLNSKNGFLLYLCKPKLDIDKLIRLSRTMFTYKAYKAQTKSRNKMNVSDRVVRDIFIKDFPGCTPQELDELIEFANYHR